MNIGGHFEPGTIVCGKYRIERVIGRGGMGVVYAAVHTQLDQRVALKFLSAISAGDAELLERFAREARACARIESEHIARVIDVGEVERGKPFIVMEYLEGKSLDRIFETQPKLPIALAVDYILQACEAIAEAHAHGIIHRDIKPANLFLARRMGRSVIKVLDFGISKLPTTTRHYALTADSALMGSPGFMSPEQMMNAASVDARSDIWSLASVLYRSIAGKAPFVAENIGALINFVLNMPHVSLGVVVKETPTELEAVIDQCLQKEPDRRPKSVAELALRLAPFGPNGSADRAARIHQISIASMPMKVPAADKTIVDGSPLEHRYNAATIIRAPGMRAPSAAPAAPALHPQRTLTLVDPRPLPLPMDPARIPSERPGSKSRGALYAGLAAVIFAASGATLAFAWNVHRAHRADGASSDAITSSNASARPSSASPPSPSATEIASIPPPSISSTEPTGNSASNASTNASNATTNGTSVATARGPRVKPPSTGPSAVASAAPSSSGCHVISTVDEQGDKRFKQVCP